MNGKRYFLCICRKWKLCILALILGALVCTGIYEVSFFLQTKQEMYQSEALFYVKVDDQKSYNFYNSYTWNTVIKSDPILNCAEESVKTIDSSITKDEIKNSCSADIASDLRYLTVEVTTDSVEKTRVIMNGLIDGLEQFHGDVAEIANIEMWSVTEPALVEHENLFRNAVVFGTVLGFLLWIVCISIYYAVEDSIYTINDVKEHTEAPVLGIRCKKENEVLRKLLESSLEKAQENTKEIEWIELSVDQESTWNMNELKEKNVIVTISFGNRNGKKLDLLLNELQKHEIEVAGVIITEADNRFMKDYYRV